MTESKIHKFVSHQTYSDVQSIILFIIGFFVIIMIIVGNFLVIFAVVKDHTLKNLQNWLIGKYTYIYFLSNYLSCFYCSFSCICGHSFGNGSSALLFSTGKFLTAGEPFHKHLIDEIIH